MSIEEFVAKFGLLTLDARTTVTQVMPSPPPLPPPPPDSPTSSRPSQIQEAHELLTVKRCLVAAVLDSYSYEGRFEIGNTKVYFKAGVLEDLEKRRGAVLEKCAATIQRHQRGRRRR
jgi:myosin heavy subunit